MDLKKKQTIASSSYLSKINSWAKESELVACLKLTLTRQQSTSFAAQAPPLRSCLQSKSAQDQCYQGNVSAQSKALIKFSAAADLALNPERRNM